jgi:hypothetical protein
VRLDRIRRGRVARGAEASNRIGGAARLYIFDKIDPPEREEKGEIWQSSVEAQLRGGVRNFKQTHDLEI